MTALWAGTTTKTSEQRRRRDVHDADNRGCLFVVGALRYGGNTGNEMYHEKADDDTCPNCGGKLDQDWANIGIGVVYGPAGCHNCGWSEEEQFDSSEEPRPGVSPTGLVVRGMSDS